MTYAMRGFREAMDGTRSGVLGTQVADPLKSAPEHSAAGPGAVILNVFPERDPPLE